MHLAHVELEVFGQMVHRLVRLIGVSPVSMPLCIEHSKTSIVDDCQAVSLSEPFCSTQWAHISRQRILILLFSLGCESLLIIPNELINVHLVLILKVLERRKVDSTEVILSSLLAAMLTTGAAGLLQDILAANLVPVLRLNERVSLALLLLIHGTLLPQNF